jgi:hypothetical protein
VRTDLGSDFELVEPRWLTREAVSPPWLPGPNSNERVHYFQSGRQALTAVATQLRQSGRDRLLLPEYFCDSMLEPFVRDHWEVRLLSVTADLSVEPESVRALLEQPERTVILSAPYFGKPASQGLGDALTASAEAGAIVVADETHNWFSGPSRPAHFRVGSLRKMLPLPDGAYLAGPLGESALVEGTAEDSVLVTLRRHAMAEKSRYLRGDHTGNLHLELFREAECMVETRLRPMPMSARSHDLITQFDYQGIAERRRANARTIVRALNSSASSFRPLFPCLEGVVDWVPSHVVLSGPDPIGLRRHLASHRIFCPIHWPPSRILPPRRGWPSYGPSIPVDHRYGEADMERVAAAVQSYKP